MPTFFHPAVGLLPYRLGTREMSHRKPIRGQMTAIDEAPEVGAVVTKSRNHEITEELA